jgi:hypothetical protein
MLHFYDGIFKMVSRFFTFISAVAFTTNLYASGAGVLPMFAEDATVLVGEEPRRSKAGVPFVTITDFGGKIDKKESPEQAARRELDEETGYGSFPKITTAYIAKSPYVEYSLKAGFYREYLVTIHGPKPSIAQIVNNAKAAKKKLGKNAHVEKRNWFYLPARVLLKAALTNNPSLPGRSETLYGPFMACLRKPTTINALQNLIANAAAKKAAKAKAAQAAKVKAAQAAKIKAAQAAKVKAAQAAKLKAAQAAKVKAAKAKAPVKKPVVKKPAVKKKP